MLIARGITRWLKKVIKYHWLVSRSELEDIPKRNIAIEWETLRKKLAAGIDSFYDRANRKSLQVTTDALQLENWQRAIITEVNVCLSDQSAVKALSEQDC